MLTFIFLMFLWAFFAFATAIAASNRGRFGLIWFIWGCLFGIFAFIIVLVMRDKSRR